VHVSAAAASAADADMNINRDYIRLAWSDLHKSSAHAAISSGNLLFADITYTAPAAWPVVNATARVGVTVRRARSEEAGMVGVGVDDTHDVTLLLMLSIISVLSRDCRAPLRARNCAHTASHINEWSLCSTDIDYSAHRVLNSTKEALKVDKIKHLLKATRDGFEYTAGATVYSLLLDNENLHSRIIATRQTRNPCNSTQNRAMRNFSVSTVTTALWRKSSQKFGEPP